MSGARRIAASLIALLLAGGAATARAADEAQVLRLRAEQLAVEGHCDQALPVVQQSRRLAPGDARAALLEGQCAIRLGRYAEAIAPLEDARRLDPELAEAALYLAMAHYQRGALDRARAELDTVGDRLPGRAEVHFYRGMLLLEAAEGEAAAAALERAAELDPRAVDPAATYYAGRAWQTARRRERAVALLRRVVAQAPGSVWAQRAEQALAEIAAPTRLRARLTARVGLEYDSNVVLRSEGSSLPSEISSRDDGRGVWDLEGAVELFRNDRWAGGLTAGYGGSAHFELDDFDVHFPNASLWLDRVLDEHTFVRLQPDFGFAWLDEDPFLLRFGGTLTVFREWGRSGSGEAFARYGRRVYEFELADVPGPSAGATPGFCTDLSDPVGDPAVPFCSPAGLDEGDRRDRDGEELVAGYDHSLPVGGWLVLKGGARYHRYWADGREFSYHGPEVWLGSRILLPYSLAVETSGSYQYQRYHHRSTFDPVFPGFNQPYAPGSRRRDNAWRAAVEIERPLTENLKVSALYRYDDNGSNVDVFDYHRHLVGVYLTLTLGK